MKILSRPYLKLLIPAFMFITFGAYAQKTPSVQTASVYAPANIKIDGRSIEWNDKFQAYNNHVEFFYTLSNDDKNLYMIVQAVDRGIVRRIINGGITLAISKTGKKNDKDVASITFPLFDKDNRFSPRYNGPTGAGRPMFISGTGGGGGGGTMVMDVVAAPVARTTTVAGGQIKGAGSGPLTPEQVDSIMRANNTNFAAKAKNIGTKGITGIDSLISVYNEEGIKAAGTFDNKTVFTCELAIPLKYLGLDSNSAVKFMYHVLINEVEQKGVNITYDNNNPTKITTVNISSGAQMGQDATDFWGEYTLAKK